jgi:hypothetical protein
MPATLRYLRDATLRAIQADMSPHQPPTSLPATTANLDRLFYLAWPGATPGQCARKRDRTDTGRQPSHPVLRMALWYMRQCINLYSASCPSQRPGTPPRVHRLPIYGHSPFGPPAQPIET